MIFKTPCPECGGNKVVGNTTKHFCTLCQGKGQVGLECEGRLLTKKDVQLTHVGKLIGLAKHTTMVSAKSGWLQFNGHPVKVVEVGDDKA